MTGPIVSTPAADSPRDYGRYLIHGPQGAGKTTLASSIAGCGKTLFLDLMGEKGTDSFRGAPWEPNIEIARPSSVTELDDLYWTLDKGAHDWKAVVVDSLTSVQKLSMRFMLGHSETAVREIRQGVAPADQRTWGQTLDIMADTGIFWFSLADGNRANPVHVVMTAQTKITVSDDTGETTRVPDVQRGALPLVLATPNFILYCDFEDPNEYDEDGNKKPERQIVRFGNSLAYRTKARVPYHLSGKIGPILGRDRPLNLTSLSRVLGLGGVPAKTAAATTEKGSA